MQAASLGFLYLQVKQVEALGHLLIGEMAKAQAATYQALYVCSVIIKTYISASLHHIICCNCTSGFKNIFCT